jgi:hypothetical protein
VGDSTMMRGPAMGDKVWIIPALLSISERRTTHTGTPQGGPRKSGRPRPEVRPEQGFSVILTR